LSIPHGICVVGTEVLVGSLPPSSPPPFLHSGQGSQPPGGFVISYNGTFSIPSPARSNAAA